MASHAQACDFDFRGSDSLFVHVNQNQLKPLNTSPLKSLGINAQKKTKLPSALKGDNVKDFKYAFICWYAKGRAAGRLSRRQRETLKNLSQSCSFAGFVFWISSAELGVSLRPAHSWHACGGVLGQAHLGEIPLLILLCCNLSIY